MTLNQRLDLIEPKIFDKRFLTGKGLANEINFWIFDYDSQDELAVRSYVKSFIKRTNSKQDDVCIKCFDLFDIMIDILLGWNYVDKIMQMERNENSEAIIDPLRHILLLTDERDLIIAKIVEDLTPEKDIVFLTGIGKAWPIIRSHTILNNLHSKVDKNPLIMFFPGNYTDELRLFEEITDDNYYRALKLIPR